MVYNIYNMWEIHEHRLLRKRLKRLSSEILKRYEKWKDIVYISGPEGLRHIKGFHDEALKGRWRGYRSSRLGMQQRVIYKVIRNQVLVRVLDITPHDYGRK